MTENERAERFLELYKRLEVVAEDIVGSMRRGSPIVTMSNMPRFSRYKQELDYCREVRNLLSHEVKLGGDFPVVPSEKVTELLEGILQKIENPPTVMSRATPADKIVYTTRDEPVLKLMRRMKARNLTNAPLIENRAVVGVFSDNTLYQYLLERGSAKLSEQTTVGEFDEFLPLTKHIGSSFVFVSRDTLLDEARGIFDAAYQREKKLKMLLITARGRSNEPLEAVITPYDLLERD